MDTRKLTSLILAWSFVILTITSIILYITPAGRVAYWANWSLLGLDKHQWGALHTNVGYLFLAASIFHIVLNWKLILNYMKKKTKEAFAVNTNTVVSAVVVLVISVFTLGDVPPVSWIQSFGESLKDASELKYGSPPYGHAEDSSLELFCKRTDLDLEEAKEKLAKAGITFTSEKQTIEEIALANNLTPQAVAVAIAPRNPGGTGSGQGQGMGNPYGTGKRMGLMKLPEISEVTGVPLAELQQKLKDAGFSTDTDKMLKEIASEEGKHPSELISILGLDEFH